MTILWLLKHFRTLQVTLTWQRFLLQLPLLALTHLLSDIGHITLKNALNLHCLSKSALNYHFY